MVFKSLQFSIKLRLDLQLFLFIFQPLLGCSESLSISCLSLDFLNHFSSFRTRQLFKWAWENQIEAYVIVTKPTRQKAKLIYHPWDVVQSTSATPLTFFCRWTLSVKRSVLHYGIRNNYCIKHLFVWILYNEAKEAMVCGLAVTSTKSLRTPQWSAERVVM